ncbi:MAG: GNAT family N-acetyltransferase [Actinomycetota bacterium]|nr:GNAT family N-acetyltransferase [Actinomycetota bacterium]
MLTARVRRRLERHLTMWLGQWPPPGGLVVATAPGRVEPGWDGHVHPVIGVSSPAGMVLSVPPDVVVEARRIAGAGGLTALSRKLGTLLGRPGDRLQAGVFRWPDSPVAPADLPDAGIWVPHDDPRVPGWMHPFGGEVLVALSDGVYAAGVGVKHHDRFGQELAVGTEERFAGRGWGRRLVAQAARRVIDEGKVPTYLHDARNIASAKVAEAAGFPDRGWQVWGLWP